MSSPFSVDILDTLCHDKNVLAALRKEHWQAFEEQGLPTRKQELWKYTDLSRLLAKQQFAAQIDEAISVTSAAPYCIVLANGTVDLDQSRLPVGVSVTSIIEASPEETAKWAAALSTTDRPMVAMNTALMTAGVVIEVPENTQIDAPIVLHYVDSGEQVARHYRHRIVLGAGAQCQITEVVNCQQSLWLNTVNQVQLGRDAQLQHHQFTEAMPLNWVNFWSVEQYQGSQYEHFQMALGADLLRNDIDVQLVEPRAQCALNGIYALSGQAHFDVHTRVDHRADDTRSDEWFKGVASDRARGVFNGKAVAHAGTKRIEAYQRNQNLLLSEQAHIDTKPELEIYTDDIQCAHGATVGQLEESALFYLQSRGFSSDQAAQLLKQAFLKEVLGTIAEAQQREQFEQHLDAYLAK